MIYCIFERHDVLSLKLSYQIGELETISDQNLFEYLGNNEEEQLNNLIILFRNTKITSHNFMQIRKYCQQLLKQFLQIHNYDLVQQQYILLYLILEGIENPRIFSNLLVMMYQALPQPLSTDPIVPGLKREIKYKLIQCYIQLGLDVNTLINS